MREENTSTARTLRTLAGGGWLPTLTPDSLGITFHRRFRRERQKNGSLVKVTKLKILLLFVDVMVLYLMGFFL